MPDSAFLDSHGWLALLHTGDQLHGAAKERWAAIDAADTVVYLTDWIIAETGKGLARSPFRGRLRQAIERLRANPRIRIVPVRGKLLDQALDLYDNRPDKTWGLVDCASFVVMQRHGIREAFTNDRHLQQAGFTCLLDLPRTKV